MIKLLPLVLLASLLAATCAAPVRLSPDAFVQKAYAASEAVTTAHFTFTTTMSGSAATQPVTGTVGSGPLNQSFSGEGDYAPGKMRMTMKLSGQTIEQIVVGKTMYQRLPGSDKWQKRDVPFDVSTTPTLQATHPRDLLKGLKSASKITELPDETIDGVRTHHYKVDVDSAQYQALAQEKAGEITDPALKQAMAQAKDMLKDMQMSMEIWAGRDDFIVRQGRIDMSYQLAIPGKGDQRAPFTMSMAFKFSDFNKPVEINAPDLAQVVEAPLAQSFNLPPPSADAWRTVARQVSHPVFMPGYVPAGLDPAWPSRDMNLGFVVQNYRSKTNAAALMLIQGPASAFPGGMPGQLVQVGDGTARYQEAGDKHFLHLERDGTRIELQAAREVSKDDLVKLAASLQKVSP